MQCYICHSNQFCAAIFYLTINFAHSWPGILRPWGFINPDTPIALLFLSHMHWVSVKPSEQNWDSLWVGYPCCSRVWVEWSGITSTLPPAYRENLEWSVVRCAKRLPYVGWMLMSISCLFTGMRSSCQVLIFINLKKALEGVMCRSTKCVCSSYCYAKLATATDKSGPFLYLKVLWIEGEARACMRACDRRRRVGLNTGLR